MGRARYDDVAEWYDRELATSPFGLAPRKTVLRLLGDGPGSLLDVGCGGGSHTAAFGEHGWAVTGVDVSEEQLRLARGRGLEVVQAHAEDLPLENASFDAVVSMWTHTDIDGWATALHEVARVLRPGGSFVYLGVHPCFVGPHSLFAEGRGLPLLHPGYRRAGRYTDAPGITAAGLRAKVGATHLPLAQFLQTFIDARLGLEHVEEPGEREYPIMIALRCRR